MLRFLISFILVLGHAPIARAQLELKDLGLSEAPAVESSADRTTRQTLERRHSMLKRHEVLGLATLGVMTATMLTGGSAIDSNAHMYLGMASGALYFTTAYFSLAAPKPAGVKDRGNIVWHKRLAWIHFPAMVLAPILGYIYKRNEENDRKSSGLVKQHPTIAGVGYGAFALSAALMTVEF
jgi:hypothetical protein